VFVGDSKLLQVSLLLRGDTVDVLNAETKSVAITFVPARLPVDRWWKAKPETHHFSEIDLDVGNNLLMHNWLHGGDIKALWSAHKDAKTVVATPIPATVDEHYWKMKLVFDGHQASELQLPYWTALDLMRGLAMAIPGFTAIVLEADPLVPKTLLKRTPLKRLKLLTPTELCVVPERKGGAVSQITFCAPDVYSSQ
jgi:hypothetical protein